ncbi:DUF1616 domain-containing protein [Natrinema sp. SYSU A 869]|uniref:DUF1616 domain-containing protein n=1 Tax=Natrinema sp. SYSU A 869 TaxID=2871694 RepID=UPI001CA4602B|nr:DUF1616 domain-containing protein [Natrinema sp. SYSU A 869]
MLQSTAVGTLLIGAGGKVTAQETNEEDELRAAVSFNDQATDGTSVVIDTVTLLDGGFVSVQDPTAAHDPDPWLVEGETMPTLEEFFSTTVLGSSERLEPGIHDDVEIEFDTPPEESRQLLVMAHRDTTDDEAFDYADELGEEDDGYPTGVDVNRVVDDGAVELEEDDETAGVFEVEAPEEVDAGEPVEIIVSVTNDTEEDFDSDLVIGFGNETGSSSFTVAAGETETVMGTFETDDLGGEEVDWLVTDYGERVDAGTITVQE